MLPGLWRHPPVTSRPSIGQITQQIQSRSRTRRSQSVVTQLEFPKRNYNLLTFSFIPNLYDIIWWRAKDVLQNIFVFHRRNKVIQVWNGISTSKSHKFHPFNISLTNRNWTKCLYYWTCRVVLNWCFVRLEIHRYTSSDAATWEISTRQPISQVHPTSFENPKMILHILQ